MEKIRKKIGGYIPAELMDETKKYSIDSGLKIAAILEKALKEYFAKYKLLEPGTTEPA
jgi:hypothetical protein